MSDPQKIVTNVFKHMSFTDATIQVKDTKEAIEIDVTVPEEASGMLIGYRGEKINALQLIFTIMLNNDVIAYRPVHLDINGYRRRREDDLREMADAAATNAIDSGREIILPPLKAFERRIVHMHLDGNDQVETYSEGEDRSRRLVVRPVSH